MSSGPILFIFISAGRRQLLTRVHEYEASHSSLIIRLDSHDSSKVTELESGRMRVRTRLEVTTAETGGQSVQTNFTLSAHSLACLATGNFVFGDLW